MMKFSWKKMKKKSHLQTIPEFLFSLFEWSHESDINIFDNIEKMIKDLDTHPSIRKIKEKFN